jgi:hypothetical protein
MTIAVNPFVYWVLWLVTDIVVIALAHKRRRQKGFTDEEIIITAGFSLAGVFALIKVLVNVINHHEDLQSKLDWDGVTAISISCILGITIALKEIRKLF